MPPGQKLLGVSMLLLAGCHPHHPSTNARKAVDAIKAEYAQRKHAFKERDLNGIMGIYAPNVVVYDATPPLQFDGADAYRKGYSDFLALFKGPLKVADPSIRIEQSGNVAFAFGLEHLRGTLTNGRTVDIWLRFTDGWERRNGQWRIAHEHVSLPVDLATGKARLDLTP